MTICLDAPPPPSQSIQHSQSSLKYAMPADSQVHAEQRAKLQVARQFSRAAQSYDQAARIQHFSALALVKQLVKAHNKHLETMTGDWLDLGCGTGFAAPELLRQGAQHVIGADLSYGMSRTSDLKLADLPFQAVTADAENLPFAQNCFNGIYSNLMVQWSEQIHVLFNEAHRVLKSNGLFAFATLGPRTMHELKSAWQQVDPYVHVNAFSSKQEVIQQCQMVFEVISIEQQEVVQQHKSLTNLLKELKAIGATNVNSGRRQGLGGRARLQQLERAYQTIQEPLIHLPLTYDLIWVVARKR